MYVCVCVCGTKCLRSAAFTLEVVECAEKGPEELKEVQSERKASLRLEREED